MIHMPRFAGRVCLLVLFTLLFFALPTSGEAKGMAQAFSAEYEPTDCFFDTGSELVTPASLGFECGYVTVPELHALPDGATIRIPVAIYKTTGENPEPDPLFLAQGGPGGDAFGVFAITAPSSPIAQNRDIVIFNQRGTRYAEPRLDCFETRDIRPELFATDDEDEASRLSKEAMATCRERLVNEEGINLSAFDSLENAADIDLIRQALGYETFNFYGVSYGTLLGLHLMRLNPSALRSVILDSVVPTQTNFVTQVARTENGAYDEYFTACADDPTCSEMYPDLEARLTAVYKRLNETPVEVEFTNADTGETFASTLNGDSARGIIFQLFYVQDFYAALPRLVSDLEQSDFDSLTSLASLFLFDETSSDGMYFSVLCAEDSDFTAADVSVDGVRAFIAEGAAEDATEIVDVCEMWDVEALPDSVDDPVVSDIPTLLISGRFDPITPASYAAEAATTLSNSYNVVNPTGSHGNIFGGNACSQAIATQFLDDPSQTPDTSCYDEIELADVIDTEAIPLPILRDLANLEIPVMAQVGAMIIFAVLLLSGLLFWPIAWLVRKIRGREKVVENGGSRIFGRILTLATGVSVFVMLGGLTYTIFNLFENTAYLIYGVVPANSRVVFMLVPVILVLALLGIVFLLRSWRDASVAGKIYQALLLLCLVGISVLLFTLQLFTPLFA